MKIKLKKSKRVTAEGVLGIAWYRPWQWDRLREIAVDRDKIEDTYGAWLAVVRERLPELHRVGVYPLKVDVDVEELLAWCEQQGRPVNADARAQFVAEKTRSGQNIMD